MQSMLKHGRFPSIGDAEDEEMGDGDISSEDWQVVENPLPGTVEKGTKVPKQRSRGSAFPPPHFDEKRRCPGDS